MSNNLIVCEGLKLEVKQIPFEQHNSEYEINFYLQPNFIKQFELNPTGSSLRLGDRWIEQLYYDLFFEFNSCFRLNFCTYYQHHQRQQAIISSTVFADGEVIQQINSHYLSTPQLTEKAVIIHHHLIETILARLSIHKPKINLNWLSALLAGLIISLIIVFALIKYTFGLEFLLGIILSFIFLYWGIKQLLLLAYRRWWRTVWSLIIFNNNWLAQMARKLIIYSNSHTN